MVEVVVITGNQAAAVQRLMAAAEWPRPLRCVFNQDWQAGQGFSVAAGVRAVRQSSPTASGILFMLADQPRLRPATLAALLEYFEQLAERARQAIIFPVYGGQRGNPVIFGQGYFDELEKLEGDAGGRTIVKAYPQAVLEVTVDDPAIHEDLDTPEDLLRLKYDSQ